MPFYAYPIIILECPLIIRITIDIYKGIFNGILPITDKEVQPMDENTALGAMLLAEQVGDWHKEKQAVA